MKYNFDEKLFTLVGSIFVTNDAWSIFMGQI